MDKKPTLLVTCLQKINQKKFLIAPLVVVLLLMAGCFVYFKNINNNRQEKVLGEEDIATQEVISENGNSEIEETEANNSETQDQQKPEAPSADVTSTVTKANPNQSTINNSLTNVNIPANNEPPQEEQPNYCKDSDISIYRQIIATSESSIKSYNAYLASPKTTYEYTYQYDQCGWTKSDCIANAEAYFLQTTGWTYQESGSHGCSYTAKCSNAIEKRTEMMNTCSAEKQQCLTSLDTWLTKKIADTNTSIEWREGLIIENQNKLAICGLQ